MVQLLGLVSHKLSSVSLALHEYVGLARPYHYVAAVLIQNYLRDSSVEGCEGEFVHKGFCLVHCPGIGLIT